MQILGSIGHKASGGSVGRKAPIEFEIHCAWQTAAQIEAKDRRTGGRLAMASVDTQATEGEIDRIRSLGLEDLRREWRWLNHGEPPRISRDLLMAS
jgi:hypothetical protein